MTHPHTPPTAVGALTRFPCAGAKAARIDLNRILKAANLTRLQIEDQDTRLIVRDRFR